MSQRVCPVCGGVLSTEGSFCARCGGAVPSDLPPGRRNPWPWIAAGVVGFFVISVLLVILLSLFSFYSMRASRAGRPVPRVTQAQPRLPAPAKPEQLRGNGRVYLVPLGQASNISFPELVRYYREKFQLSLKLLPSVPLPQGLPVTHQWAAEELIAHMKHAYPALVDDPQSILIGVTDRDIYIWEYDWSYAFNFRQDGRFAVLSTARLDPVYDREPPNPALVDLRLRKMLTKNLGILYYGLDLSRDPHSVLYGSILGVDDLDTVSDDFFLYEVEKVRPDRLPDGRSRLLDRDEGDPCLTFVHQYQPAPRLAWSSFANCGSLTPTDTGAEAFQVDLRLGLVILRKTDFYLSDYLPIRLTRTYRNQDKDSRPFGIGGNHPYGVFLWSANESKEADLILETGGRVHLRRTTFPFFLVPAVYEGESSNDEFSRARLEEKWPKQGWQLKLADGRVYEFADRAPLQSICDRWHRCIVLERPGGTRDSVRRITAPSGRGLEFDNDAAGRILRARDPDGRTLSYTYDAGGHLVQVTDGAGWLVRYAYDQAGNLTAASDAAGIRIVGLNYDKENRVIQFATSDGLTYDIRYVYQGPRHVRTDVTDSRGRSFSAVFDGEDYLVFYHHESVERTSEASRLTADD